MNRHRTLLLIALVFYLPAALISACAGPTPACGQNISDQTTQISHTLWSPGSSCRYMVVIEESSLITVQMNRLDGDLDPFLALVDEAGTALVEDDDSGGNGDALIENFLAERPGRYVIVASSYGNDGTGAFELLVDIQSEPQ